MWRQIPQAGGAEGVRGSTRSNCIRDYYKGRRRGSPAEAGLEDFLQPRLAIAQIAEVLQPFGLPNRQLAALGGIAEQRNIVIEGRPRDHRPSDALIQEGAAAQLRVRLLQI